MITVSNVSLSFGGQLLFKDVDLKFTNGNCYGIIGANGAGKSTFLKILCGEIEPTTGEVVISKEDRLSVLRQDHFAFDEYTVLETVIMGNKRLYEIMKEKDELYAKEDFTEEDGDRAGQLESEFAELNGWEAESDASDTSRYTPFAMTLWAISLNTGPQCPPPEAGRPDFCIATIQLYFGRSEG